jgi:hypothetical protein
MHAHKSPSFYRDEPIPEGTYNGLAKTFRAKRKLGVTWRVLKDDRSYFAAANQVRTKA